MSLFDVVTLCCPKCTSEQQETVYTSINQSRAPHLRDAIIERRLHRFVCHHCQHTMLWPGSFGYADWSRAQYYYTVGDTHQSIDEYHQALLQSMAKVQREERALIPKDTQIRLIHGLEHLREKLLIAELGHDDRIIELVKAQYLTDLARSEPQSLRLVIMDYDSRFLYGTLYHRSQPETTPFQLSRSLLKQIPSFLAAEYFNGNDYWIDHTYLVVPNS